MWSLVDYFWKFSFVSYNSDSTRSITFYRTKKHGREVILLHFENRSYKIRLKKGHVHLETAVFGLLPGGSKEDLMQIITC